MNNNDQGAPGRSRHFAIFLILIVGLSGGLQAQIIYKCGSNYSQTPCAGASTLRIDDARTSAQQQQTDAAVRSDAKRAQALEKDRLAQEKANRIRPTAAKLATPPTVAPVTPRDTHNVVSVITPKRLKSPTYKPEAFIALVPGSDKKPVNKKASKNKATKPD